MIDKTGGLRRAGDRRFSLERGRRAFRIGATSPAGGGGRLSLGFHIGSLSSPDAELLGNYRDHGGPGPGIAAVKVCWDQDEKRARKLAHELWPTEHLSGQLSQKLPMPSHFEAAAEVVTEDMVGDTLACGPDPEKHVKAISSYLDAGSDQVDANQIGPDQEGFFDFYVRELRPRLDASQNGRPG